MPKTIEQILEGSIKHVDLSIIAYLSNVLQEAINEGHIICENDVHLTLYEGMKLYAICSNEDESYQISVNIFNDLLVNKHVKDPSILKKEIIQSTKIGSHVMARYSLDGQWYHARVDNITDSEIFVTYIEYGNQEWLDPLHVQSLETLAQQNSSTGLATTEKIDDEEKVVDTDDAKAQGIKLSDKKLVDDVSEKINQLMYKTSRYLTDTTRDDKQLAEFGLTSRQKKKVKEEMKEKEKVARFDPLRYMKSLRQKARPEWFDPSKRGGSRDIVITGYSMYSLDEKHLLLDHIDIKLVDGVHYGFVGLNGAGKTTLLRRMSRYDIPGFPPHLKILHVEQEIIGDETTVLDYVLSFDVVRKELMDREQKLMEEKKSGNDEAISQKLADLYELMKQLDVLNVEPRAKEILSGLGFSEDMMSWTTNRLSGGWRMRVSLAGALFVKPDILLLDEPTNHLDFPTVVWLENYLQSFDGTLLVVSHDREFLNNVASIIIHINNKQLLYFKGTFKNFIDTTKRKYDEQMSAYKAQQLQIAHIKEYIDKWRYNANRAALVQSRIKTLQNMARVEKPEEIFTMRFTFPSCEKVDGTVVALRKVIFGYDPKKILINNVDCSVDQRSRIGCIGANGAGKSTLLKLMIGQLQPLFGEVAINRNARIRVFTQHHIDQLDLSLSPMEYLLEKFAADCKKEKRPAEYIRGKLGRFGLQGDLVTQRMAFLSGGQKSRVAFTVLTWDDPNLIIMDEPTNHLDFETEEALIGALQEWNGGLMIVSHDQYFLSCVAKEFWTLSTKLGKILRYSTLEEAKLFAMNEKQIGQ